MANRFEQVDEVVARRNHRSFSSSGRTANGRRSIARAPRASFARGRPDQRAVPPKDALSGAVKLANELKLAIVVVDPDGVWKKEWGELYRWQDDAEAE